MEGDLIQGTLQSLLQNRQQLQQNQQRAQQQQLSTMRTPLPQTGPIEQMVSDYLTKYAANPGMGWSAAASAIGGQAERSRKMDESQLLRMQAADEAEAKMAGDALKEQDLFAGRLSVSKAVSGKQPSPEQLRTVYNGLRNEAAQAAKGYNFASPLEREQWIEDYANRGVQNYLENFVPQPDAVRGTKLPAPGATPQVPGATQFQKLEPLPTLPKLSEMPQATGVTTLGVPPGQGTPDLNKLTPTEQGMAQALQGATRMANNPATAAAGNQMLGGLQQQFPLPTVNGIQPGGEAIKQPSPAATTLPTTASATVATKVQPSPRNIPREEAAKQGAKDMAGAYVEDYKTVQAAATAAAEQRAVFDMLEKNRPKTGMFADAEKVVGGLFAALGQNPNDPTIQNAMKTRNAEQLVSQLTNAALKAEKGVQTKTDEVRIFKEFPKTTDIQKVWDFSIKLGKERAQRKLDQRDFFEGIAAQNNGTPIAARQQWDKEMESDPITQYLGGQLIFRSDFIKAYERKYPDLGKEAAVAKWRELEQDYRGRGGRK